MSLSNLCIEQHERDQTRLRRLLMLGLLGSVGLHAIAFGLSQLGIWRRPNFDIEAPIEIIVMEPPAEIVEEPEPAQLSTETNSPPPPADPRVNEPQPPAAPAEPEPLDPLEPLEDTQVESQLTLPEAPTPPDPDRLNNLREYLQRGQQNNPPAPAASTETAARTGSGSANTAPSNSGSGRGSRTVACRNCVRPQYPRSALEAGAEGQPVVNVQINPDGRVSNVTLIRSSGNAAIDRAAMQAARRSRFEPIEGGASIPIEYDLTIEGSQRNRDARERGERRSVEVAAPSEPESTAQTADGTESESPPAAAPTPDTNPEPGASSAPSSAQEAVETTPAPTNTNSESNVAPVPDPAQGAAETPTPNAESSSPQPEPSNADVAPESPATPAAAPSSEPPTPSEPVAPEPVMQPVPEEVPQPALEQSPEG